MEKIKNILNIEKYIQINDNNYKKNKKMYSHNIKFIFLNKENVNVIQSRLYFYNQKELITKNEIFSLIKLEKEIQELLHNEDRQLCTDILKSKDLFIIEITASINYNDNITSNKISDLCDMGSYIKKRITIKYYENVEGLLWISSKSDGVCLYFCDKKSGEKMLKELDSDSIIKQIKRAYKNTPVSLIIREKRL